MSVATVTIDPAHLRRVYGTFPTGVAAVAALIDGAPVGMAASSFTTVSLEPPLVSVCVAHTSTTWPVLRRAPRLGVNVLAAAQAAAGRQLAAKGVDRFAGLTWRATDGGAVIIDGVSGWFDVSIDNEIRAGDHNIIVLRVHDLDGDHDRHPLIFHASTFRRLEPPPVE